MASTGIVVSMFFPSIGFAFIDEGWALAQRKGGLHFRPNWEQFGNLREGTPCFRFRPASSRAKQDAAVRAMLTATPTNNLKCLRAGCPAELAEACTASAARRRIQRDGHKGKAEPLGCRRFRKGAEHDMQSTMF